MKKKTSPQTPPMNDEMRDRIIEASVRYMKVHGSQKLSMVDVAKTAGISRATVYNYFDSKESLIDAAQQALDKVFFEGLNASLVGCKNLTEQVAAIAIFIRQSWTDRNHTPWYGFLSPLDEARLFASKAGEHTLIMMNFLKPYVQAAKKSGELRSDIDIGRATEWIARIIMSFAYSSPAPKMDNPAEIKRLFNDFLMKGLG